MSEKTPKDKLYRKILGSMSKRQGRTNEDKSIKHILDNYDEYRVPDISHTHKTPRGTRHHTDLFYTTYIDRKGEKQKAGFDIVCLTSNECVSPPVLVQVKSTRLPDSLYIKALQDFKVYARKELHIWVDDELQILPL